MKRPRRPADHRRLPDLRALRSGAARRLSWQPGPLRRLAPRRPDPTPDVDEALAATPIPTVRVEPVVPQFLAVTLGLAGFVIGIAGIRAAADLVAPVFLGLNLMIAAAPMHAGMLRLGVPRIVSATLTGLTVVAALLAFFGLLGWSLAALIALLPEYGPRFSELYQSGLEELGRLGLTPDDILVNVQRVNPQDVIGLLQGVLSNAQYFVSMLTVLVTVLVFLMMDLTGFQHRLVLAAGDHPQIVRTLVDFGRGVRRYWLVTTAFGLVVAVLDVVALLIIGVPLALVWGVVSFLTNYIPNIGFVIGLVPPALLALLDGGPGPALAVVVAYCLLNFVIQSLIQPKVAGDAVGVTPTVSFVSLIFWTWVLGPLGALLALPSTLLLKAVLIDGDPQARWANLLLASNPRKALKDEPSST